MALVFRIGSAGPTWDECDLEGKGAKATGGRWNNVGVPILYTSSSIALAVLETVVHLGAGIFPMNRYVVAIDIPNAEFNARLVVRGVDLPAAWNSNPASFKSKDFGSNWIGTKAELVLEVPSVIVPDESNYLINPLHKDAGKITAKNRGQYIYDPRAISKGP
jgi:RES domain-containing protein